jgi:hypothetical protein
MQPGKGSEAGVQNVVVTSDFPAGSSLASSLGHAPQICVQPFLYSFPDGSVLSPVESRETHGAEARLVHCLHSVRREVSSEVDWFNSSLGHLAVTCF